AVGRNATSAVQRVELSTLWLFRDAPGLDPNAVVDNVVMPQVHAGRYIAARRVYGSPMPPITERELATLPAPVVNQTLAKVLPLRVAVIDSSSGPVGTCTFINAEPGFADLTPHGGDSLIVLSQQ